MHHPAGGCGMPVPGTVDGEEHSVRTQCPAAAQQTELCLSVSMSSDRLALIYLKPVKKLF